jgi:hypothetical protein
VSRPVRVADPRILVGRIQTGDSEVILFVNGSADEIALEPIHAEGSPVRLIEAPSTLDPFGVAVVACDVSQQHPVGQQLTRHEPSVNSEEGGALA